MLALPGRTSACSTSPRAKGVIAWTRWRKAPTSSANERDAIRDTRGKARANQEDEDGFDGILTRFHRPHGGGATISPAARSSPSPPWPSPKPRSKFRVTPSSAASSCGATEGHAPHRWAVNWLRYGCAIAAVAAAGAVGAPTRRLGPGYSPWPTPLRGVSAAPPPLHPPPTPPPH